MPIYEYKCDKCKKIFERIVTNSDEIVICDCDYITTRIFPNKFNFELKGDGWYKDLYTKPKKQIWRKNLNDKTSNI